MNKWLVNNFATAWIATVIYRLDQIMICHND